MLPTSHRLAHRKRLRLADLVDESFVDFPTGSAGRAQSDLAFQAAGLHRDVAFEAMTTDLMIGIIRNELAVGLFSAHVVAHGPDVVAVPLADGPPVRSLRPSLLLSQRPGPTRRRPRDGAPAGKRLDTATPSPQP